MHEIGTKYEPTAEFTTADLEARLQTAHDKFDSELTRGRKDKLRIFLGPEWYHRAVGEPHTHARMRAIVEEVKAMSLRYPEWLIVPGTIVFALGYDAAAGAPALATVQADMQQYFTLTPNLTGADPLPIRAEPAAKGIWFVATRSKL